MHYSNRACSWVLCTVNNIKGKQPTQQTTTTTSTANHLFQFSSQVCCLYFMLPRPMHSPTASHQHAIYCSKRTRALNTSFLFIHFFFSLNVLPPDSSPLFSQNGHALTKLNYKTSPPSHFLILHLRTCTSSF